MPNSMTFLLTTQTTSQRNTTEMKNPTKFKGFTIHESSFAGILAKAHVCRGSVVRATVIGVNKKHALKRAQAHARKILMIKAI